MTDLIKQARECASCMIGADERQRKSCEIGSCIDVIEALADALEKAQGKIEGLDKDAAAKYLEIVRLAARAEKAERERDAAVTRLHEWERHTVFLSVHGITPPDEWRSAQEEE